MAAAMASRSTALICYTRNFNSLLCRLRLMSSADKRKTGIIYHEKGNEVSFGRVWHDKEIQSLDPYDQLRFPLPGNAAPALPSYLPISSRPKPASTVLPATKTGPELFTQPTKAEKQAWVWSQFNSALGQLDQAQNHLEVRVQDCPDLMKRDFQDLFPDCDVMRGDLTVITVCQRTDNDMTSWSAAVELEREQLMALYTESAAEICNLLQTAGFWADYIDPCSGKPFSSAYTTASMFETDERYRHFGFEIEDLGCCKVIKHHTWGTRLYVGCIFTNAPPTHPLLMDMSLTDK